MPLPSDVSFRPARQARQRQLNEEVEAICPVGLRRYINTPSVFLTPRDYFPVRAMRVEPTPCQ